jgi:hypothetical protein
VVAPGEVLPETNLFAAFNVADETVISSIHRWHRVIEFKKFLAKIDAEVPDDLDVHLVCDNYGTHKTPAINAWLANHPRFHSRQVAFVYVHAETVAQLRPPCRSAPSASRSGSPSSYGQRARFRCVRSRFPIGGGPKQVATAPDQWLRECECLRSARALFGVSGCVVLPNGRRVAHFRAWDQGPFPASGRHAHLCEKASVVDVCLL